MKRLLSFALPIALLLAAFAGGYFAGGGCHKSRGFRFEDREELRARILEKFDRELNLTAEQRKQVEALLIEKGSQFEKLREELKPRFSAIRNESKKRIEALLTEEQRPRFIELEAEWAEYRKRKYSK